ncbi:MAG: hypothetical protein ACE15D_13605 [Candidatus Eisenbacteria bacterium]|nr:hypothetical protein [Candidatus Eisenbacteria bacterium]
MELRVENTIIAFNNGGSAIEGGADAFFSCVDIYGNPGGDWTPAIVDQLGLRGNISDDPLFCDAAGGDLRLNEGSPCAPGGECDRMGAWPVGCEATAIREASWGEVKALFR